MKAMIAASLLGVIFLSITANASAQGLRALLLTTQGVYHNYASQTKVLTEGLARQMNIHFDVSLAETERWKTTDYSEGYDVLIYNICMADNQDSTLIANMRRQTETLATPTIVLHCTMHSFRNTGEWWPMYGLQTVAHDPLGPMQPAPAAAHPVLTGIAQDWTLESDELYINLSFEAQALLEAPGKDSRTHVTAWLASAGAAKVFGTTLGHSDETIADPTFQRLISNAVLYVTGNLTSAGVAGPGMVPVVNPGPAVDSLSAPPGISFLDEDGRSCVRRKQAAAVGPCYIGCSLHPLKWGQAAEACRQTCNQQLPSTREAINICIQK